MGTRCRVTVRRGEEGLRRAAKVSEAHAACLGARRAAAAGAGGGRGLPLRGGSDGRRPSGPAASASLCAPRRRGLPTHALVSPE